MVDYDDTPPMRISVRDESRHRIGTIEVDPDVRPPRAQIAGGDRDVYLDWAMALDDAGHLRRCIVCGCPNLYREKAFPQVTGFVVVLAFAGAIVGALGLATPPLLIAMGVVLVLDVAILLFSRRRLVCYRCASSFHGAPIAGYHKGWDRTMAERHGRAASEAGSPDR